MWKCKKCGNIKVIGSVEELEKLSNEKIQDLHRPHIDKVILKCECGGEMKRVVEVIDCWFDSGAMPYAQQHYPFENKEKIDKRLFFPADFICEGIDQTRGWFYTLLAISTLLKLDPAYKNVISLGLVLDSNGQKMSKSKGNIVKPQEVIDKFGADCARFYFYTINQAGEPKKFDMKEIQDLFRKFFGTLQNSYTFFSTYVDNSKLKAQSSRLQPLQCGRAKPQLKTQNLLDRWIISRLNNLNFQVVKNLDNYDIVSAARLLENFVDDLSNWYIRRSRRRFQKPKDEKEKNEATQTLHYVFLNLVKLLAPFTPFISEKIYQKLQMTNSVHLCDWPEVDEKLINEKLEKQMKTIREIIVEALAERAKNGIKVRQPLSKLKVKSKKLSVCGKNEELLDLIKEEINVKKIVFDEKIKTKIKLDTKITPELKEEGIAREIARLIQSGRKKAGFAAKDLILTKIILPKSDSSTKEILEKQKDYIKQKTNSYDFKILSKKDNEGKFDFEKEIDFEKEKLCLQLKKK